jgi:cobaltochelatase CobN
MDQANPHAYQVLTGRMLEATRKGYWDPSGEVRANLAKEYAQSVLKHGISCTIATCDNPELHLLAVNSLKASGLLPPADIERFQGIIEEAVGQNLEEMAEARRNLLSAPRPDAAPAPEAAAPAREDGSAEVAEAEPVRGLMMERVPEEGADAASDAGPSSSIIDWAAPFFLLVVVIFFVYGSLRRKKELSREAANGGKEKKKA